MNVDHELGRIRSDLLSLIPRIDAIQHYLAHDADRNRRPRCPEPGCGVELRGSHALAEHAYHAHGGPVPEHWLAAEAATAGHAPTTREAA